MTGPTGAPVLRTALDDQVAPSDNRGEPERLPSDVLQDSPLAAAVGP